ncbi:helix-turn-helix domain-containing protein [Veillonella rogosae]|uniref:helix-turn-helix domain-containing protein n=1 Tax=Veillonella rogosae TaxID=423477 RepID=UPI000B282C43|nr:helix-turn-helix transcriptional regulator [Veillonella rogosae]
MNPIVCCRDLQIRQEVHKLGVLILLWRRQLGMTQYQLADKSGLAQSYISDLESGAIDLDGLRFIESSMDLGS